MFKRNRSIREAIEFSQPFVPFAGPCTVYVRSKLCESSGKLLVDLRRLKLGAKFHGLDA
ncbi:hypothetical protein RSSM_03648 [Rhodopirellula sallentina SM41]|uniref:Uncharacterized protein n=1 Tax=Rhodopirellula sallentina SM41 TaxID=1263870 RepID=M5U0B5_9BACT|nr:hypothetical protein RSSM_03648 [Rhodopirellula sallentina SM41]